MTWTGRCAIHFLLVTGVLAQAAPQITYEEVLQLLKAQIPEAVIAEKVRQRESPLSLSADQLIALKAAGCSQDLMIVLLNPNSGTEPPAAVAAAKEDEGESKDFAEIGVYFKKAGTWAELLPEVINWKTGGFLKSMASAGVVKRDINGNIPGPHSRNSVASPLEFVIRTPEGVSITEYQLLRLHAKDDYREFRLVTGGVFNVKSGAQRDMVPFEGKKIGTRLYSVILPNNLGAGEYGFVLAVATGVAGGAASAATAVGKMYTFRLLE